MYGYLRLLNGVTPPSIQQYYKQRYCSLCHALWINYGLKTRFILSYDMTFLAVVLNLDNEINLGSRLLCYQKARFHSDQESWKRLAAMSILLATKKLEDDIADENDFKARIGLSIFRRVAKRAEEDYPEVASIFAQGFRDMSEMEHDGESVFSLARKFGDIMVEAVSTLFSSTNEDKVIMKHVTQWVYFIDAIDDLDEDVKDGSYNPFKSLASTRQQLVSKCSKYLECFISEQMTVLKPVISYYSEGTNKNWIIMSTLFDTLPIVTERVLKGETPYKKLSIIAQALQMRGGYKLA